MIKMKSLSLEALEEYIVGLIIHKQQTDDVVKKIKEIHDSLTEEQSLGLHFTNNGTNVRIIVKVINTNLPKCWIEGNQYKFNSFIASTFDFPPEREKSHATA